LLLLIPLLLYVRQRRQRPASVAYSSLHDLATLPLSGMARLRRLLFPGLRVLVLLLGIIALARPQQGLEAIEVATEGIAIAMVVDISSSMAALDLQLDGRPSDRLQVVKHSFRTFVEGAGALSGRAHDLIGMVTFARYADALCPLTLDHRTLLELLEQVRLVTQPQEDGTAIGEAIALGVDRLRASTAQSRVMILLTDGTNNAGETTPLQAAEIAKAFGIKIYTVGTGTRGMALVPVRGRDGQTVMQRTLVSIDEDTLTRIAETTGGRYFRATDGQALQAIYGEIDRLEKTTTVAEHFQQYAERFAFVLLPALGLLGLEVVLSSTRFRTIP
jgi:Ca-activated chloride channel family protein